MEKERAAITKDDTWDLEALFESFEHWKEELASIEKIFEGAGDLGKTLFLPKEKSSSPEDLVELLQNYFEISNRVEKIYTYAHLLFDQDLTNDMGKTAFGLASSMFFLFQETTSWIQPYILSIDEETMESYLAMPLFKDYSFFLEKILRLKEHTLSQEEEKLISFSEKASQTSSKSFSAFNNADIKFENATDQNEQSYPLTHGTYLKYLRSKDPVLRKSAFINLHNEYKRFGNTLCEILTGQIESHLFQKKARNYSSCLEAALYGHNVDTSVYKNLIKAVKENISSLHEYVSFRKEQLGVDQVHAYDLYAPIVDSHFEMTLAEAKETTIASVGILGEDYQEILKKGLFEKRWMDPYESKGKRSGAYSSGCCGSYPYILMNYHGTLNDAMTLAHEAGHSMHSYLSREHQPYQYADYPIFVAEVASTFNEQLLFDSLMGKASSPEEKQYLLIHELEKIHATFFRQTLFAEFELFMHETVEKGMILTPELLCHKYSSLYQEYYGKDFVVDEELSYEWARIPHFYYNFYVYQYATGISAAISLFEQVKDGSIDKEQYLSFLKMGGSRYPLDELKHAGVDMARPDAIKKTIEYFSKLVKGIVCN